MMSFNKNLKMSSLFKNKKGAVFPIRTAGSGKKSGFLTLVLSVVAIVMIGLFSMGVYNKFVAPQAEKIGLSSSLNSGEGASNSIDGATQAGEIILPTLASITFSVTDTANSDASISAGIPVGALDANSNEKLTTASDNTNETISTVATGTVLSFYGGDTTYYLEPLLNHKVTIGDRIALKASTIQTEANMLVAAYDDTGATALGAGNSTQAEDYTIALGSGQSKAIYFKLSNNAADKNYQIKAICTGYTGVNVSSLEVQGSDWTEVAMPKVVSDTAVTHYDGETSDTTGEYKKCYVYKVGTNDALVLNEWSNTPLIKMIVKAKDSKDPGADAGENIFFSVMDGAWSRGSDGKGYFDFYQHDNSQGNVGLTETLSSPTGKQLGAIIELS